MKQKVSVKIKLTFLFAKKNTGVFPMASEFVFENEEKSRNFKQNQTFKDCIQSVIEIKILSLSNLIFHQSIVAKTIKRLSGAKQFVFLFWCTCNSLNCLVAILYPWPFHFSFASYPDAQCFLDSQFFLVFSHVLKIQNKQVFFLVL